MALGGCPLCPCVSLGDPVGTWAMPGGLGRPVLRTGEKGLPLEPGLKTKRPNPDPSLAGGGELADTSRQARWKC